MVCFIATHVTCIFKRERALFKTRNARYGRRKKSRQRTPTQSSRINAPSINQHVGAKAWSAIRVITITRATRSYLSAFNCRTRSRSTEHRSRRCFHLFYIPLPLLRPSGFDTGTGCLMILIKGHFYSAQQQDAAAFRFHTQKAKADLGKL